MKATIKPETTAFVAVTIPGQEVTIPVEDGPAMMAQLKGQIEVQVVLRAGGYRLDTRNLEAALELAGLTGHAAALQMAKGYIEF